jgi:hypothetical protein
MSKPADHKRNTSSLTEDLRKWFGKGKTGGVGGGGWDRYNTKGERIGKCGDAEDRGGEGEGKPKCLSKEKAAELRAQGGKDAIANAVKRKKDQDPVTNRKGTGNAPRPVSNRIDEENKPTNPALWSKAKSLAKSKFDVYPSAYANGWASKWYKEHGGGWETQKESAFDLTMPINQVAETDDEVDEHIVKVDGKYRLVSKSGGKNLGTYDTKAGAEKRERQVQYFKHHEDTMVDIPSFKEYLQEFGDRPFTWKITVDRFDSIAAQFSIPVPPGEEPMHYDVNMMVTKPGVPPVRRPGIPFVPIPPIPLEWEFGFSLVRPRNTKHSTVGTMLRNDGYHYGTIVGDTRMSVAILSTIANIFQQFMRMKNPTSVFFTAKEASRQRLYRRLAGRAGQLPNYTSHEEGTGRFVITRKTLTPMREFSGDTIEVKPPLPGEQVNEFHPPGMEDWITANKARFKKEYGDEKGIQVLYAKAWDMYHNKNKS